jgi:hypothetical protein
MANMITSIICVLLMVREYPVNWSRGLQGSRH